MDQEDIDMSNIQTTGIMNALKTGNFTVDLLIAMSIPILMRFLFGTITQVTQKFNNINWIEYFHSSNKKIFQRKIVAHFVKRYGDLEVADRDNKNNVLIKAIVHFISTHTKTNELYSADLDLSSIKNRENRYSYYYEEDGRNDQTLYGTLMKYKIMTKHQTAKWHEVGKVEVFKEKKNFDDVEFIIQDSTKEEGEGQQKTNEITTELSLRSKNCGSIDEFVMTAYEWYKNEIKKLDDKARYLYEVQVSGSKVSGKEVGANEERCYKRYKLSDEKTFDSLFFDGKDKLLGILKHFMSKSGKYSIKGRPHKLGLLLHGPPGTGKTSLIKALAHYTERSVVNIPLSKISTNNELMNLFFDPNYNIEGEDVDVKLGFKDVIFVMEDVDAASDVVWRRDGKKTAATTISESVDLPMNKTLWQMLIESSDENCKSLVQTLIEKSDRLKREISETSGLNSIAKQMSLLQALSFVGDFHHDNDAFTQLAENALECLGKYMEENDELDRFLSHFAQTIQTLIEYGSPINQSFEDMLLGISKEKIPVFPIPKKITRNTSYTKDNDEHESYHIGNECNTKNLDLDISLVKNDYTTAGKYSSYKMKDQLNLTGLLNVLDGVVETPGRILIMTTNHPEKLDPALTRPGRIDDKYMLGYMKASNIVQMINHYYEVSLSETDCKRITNAVDGSGSNSKASLNLTPAQIEQLALEHDEVEDIIQNLEQKGLASVPSFLQCKPVSKSTIKFDI